MSLLAEFTTFSNAGTLNNENGHLNCDSTRTTMIREKGTHYPYSYCKLITLQSRMCQTFPQIEDRNLSCQIK